MKRNLTEGSITNNLLYMAIPAIMGQIARSLYDIVDMFWIGRISAAAVAGVTVFTTILFMFWILSSIIGTSSVSLIAQSYGAGDQKKTKEIIEQTISFKGLVAFITMIIVFPLLNTLIGFLTNDNEVITLALQYGYIRLAFLPIMFSSVTLSTAMRCIGDSKKPMYLMLISSVMNIILDPILMFETVPYLGIKGMGLGIQGAAWATGISGLVSFLLGFYFLLSGKSNIKISLKGLFKLKPEIDKKLILIGLPIGIEMLARESAGFIVLRLMSTYGTSVVAAIGITFRLTSLAFMMMVGLTDGSGTIVGQNLGAQKVKRAMQSAQMAAFLAFSFNCLLYIGAFMFAPQIVQFFVGDAGVIYHGTIMIRVMGFGIMLLSIGFGLSSAFSGSGYNTPFMIASMVARWGIQIPWLWISVIVLKLPFTYAVFGYAAAEITESLVLSLYYYKGKWKKHRVVTREVVLD